MFKKLTRDVIKGQTQVKSSVQRGIFTKILNAYPQFSDHLPDVAPKKTPMMLVKCPNHVQVVAVNNQPLFFQERDGVFVPSLRLLHKYPELLPKFEADEGSVRHVLTGANVMVPGLKNNNVLDPVEAGTIVAVHAKGKKHAMCIGKAEMSSEEIAAAEKGVGVEVYHFLNDGLWKLETL